MSTQDLPPQDSRDVFLAVATPEEHRKTWEYNSAEWAGSLPVEAYYRREAHLLAQDLVKDGGLTPWILVHQPDAGGPRKILCACETLKKRAFLAVDGDVKEVTCHGIGSVFCPAEHRGKGYAARMMVDLSRRIENWQHEDKQVLFSILYSDIGKKFYATHGWQPFKSSHISLPPSNSSLRANTKYLTADEIHYLCDADTAMVRAELAKSSRGNGTTVSLVPDAETMIWHQARSELYANELLSKQVPHKGSIVELTNGRRAWCYWQHNWVKVGSHKDNKLYIIRLAVSEASEHDQAELIEPLLAAAQTEAAAWGLSSVDLWSPTSATQFAALRLHADAHEIERESSSITSLLWFGNGSWRDVKWANNERYGWC